MTIALNAWVVCATELNKKRIAKKKSTTLESYSA